MFRQIHAMIGPARAGLMIAVAAAGTVTIGFSSAHAQMIPSGPEPAAAGKAAPAKGARKGQPAAESAGAAQKDPAVALRALETGIKSYEIGKLDPAVQSLTAALAGGLPSQQMARALYYRGLAFRKQAKPAQAISDLTSAIWLKGGLADAERASAIESRSAAYREAGLGEPAPVGDVTRAAAPVAAATATATAKPAAPASSWQTATATPGASAAPAPKLAAASGETPQPAQPSSTPASSGGVGGFFSGLFGGASPAGASAAAAPSTTASTAKASGPVTATSSWGDATSVASSKGRAVGAAAAVPSPPLAAAPAQGVVAVPAQSVKVAAAGPAAPAAPAYKGKFRLQVAAVRSRAEAEALAAKLKQTHGSAIGGREPAIEQSVIGAMGTFYRVRVGPYADANEPRQLCTRIKPDGFDCLVVTQ